MHFFWIFCWKRWRLLWSVSLLLAQEPPSLERGYLLPTRDTVYILVVFAEVDYTECGGYDPHEVQYGRIWPTGPDGKSQVPYDAEMLLDATLPPGQKPKGIITRTYVEASFGQFVVLGDYLPEVLRVSCKKLPPGSTQSLIQEVSLIAEVFPKGQLTTAHHVPYTAFDRWKLLPQRPGLEKLRSPTDTAGGYKPRLDILFIIWRNLAYRLNIQKPPLPCNYGFGLWACDYRQPLGIFSGGIEAASSYTSCHTAQGASIGFLEEFFHGLYGGNHWHTAGGAGWHTFPFMPVCQGLSVQGSRPTYAIGYDRWIMGWKPPHKSYLISALSERGEEISTDLCQPPRPETLRVWLRDFLSSGDAIRIRLPYTEKGGSAVKNQYLWLENRQFLSDLEVWGYHAGPEWCTDKPPENRRGFPGLYAYIQVGKDQKEGPLIYTTDPNHPNGLGSWIFMLSAEGNYDFEFRQIPHGWALDKANSLPNPFTGMNDLYLAWDADKDGQIQKGEPLGMGWWEWKGDSACISVYSAGDKEDPFTLRDRPLLSLETNPAPVPVYTLRSEEGYSYPSRARPSAYDNRTIWLNNLHIEIMREREDGAILIEIRWDTPSIRGCHRWCGNIHLSPNPYDSLAPALYLRGTIVVDRGISPVYAVAQSYDSVRKIFWFSDTSQLVIESGAILRMNKGAKIILREGSRLIIQDKGRIEGKGKIIVEPGGKIEASAKDAIQVAVLYRRKPYPLFQRNMLFIGAEK
ncbi:MAG: hypothetical protein RMJ66_05900 [Bacteroidia bacterium]|nr:hypothetical protein [Bacteroidia bacterium]MDW8134583.1 hypothetical protein [Bacteroidia bacterium]